MSQRREIPNVCRELRLKGADLIVFMRDANAENWRDVVDVDNGRCLPEHQHLSVFGVCDRNVECWLCADAQWVAREVGRTAEEFKVDDPKGVFESAMQVITTDRKEPEIAALVGRAPLHRWLRNRSFEHFYDELWLKSKEHGCQIENLRESRRE